MDMKLEVVVVAVTDVDQVAGSSRRSPAACPDATEEANVDVTALAELLHEAEE